MTNFRFRKEQHLRDPAQFDRVYDLKQRAGDNHLLMFAATNEVDITRIGLSVSKKHGNAIRRNRIKRQLREAFRLTQNDLPDGLDLVLIPRPKSGATVDDYQQSLRWLASRLDRRLHQSPDEEE